MAHQAEFRPLLAGVTAAGRRISGCVMECCAAHRADGEGGSRWAAPRDVRAVRKRPCCVALRGFERLTSPDSNSTSGRRRR